MSRGRATEVGSKLVQRVSLWRRRGEDCIVLPSRYGKPSCVSSHTVGGIFVVLPT